jgi:outer membrane protein assembly factor BamB/tetratricopeptide (TPR) repeat protein
MAIWYYRSRQVLRNQTVGLNHFAGLRVLLLAGRDTMTDSRFRKEIHLTAFPKSNGKRRSGTHPKGLISACGGAFMLPNPRAVAVLLLSGVLAILVLVPATLAQPDKPPKPEEPQATNALMLPLDSKKAPLLEAAADHIKNKKWEEAIRILQALLDLQGDVFTALKQQDASSKDATRIVSVRHEANRLLATMPAEGREAYEKLYTVEAARLLTKAKAGPDLPLLAEVSRRFFHTEPGAEATQLWAIEQADEGSCVGASLAFERVLERRPLNLWPPESLFKATVAFRKVRDKEKAEKTWQELKQRTGKKGLTIGNRTLGLEEWEKEMEKLSVPPKPFTIYDWSMYRGDPTRSAQQKGGTPFLEKRWSASTFTALSSSFRDENPQSKVQVQAAVKAQESRGQPILPSFFPIAADNKLIYRSYWGFHAVDAKTGKLMWETDSKWSLERLLKDGKTMGYLSNWLAQYNQMGRGNVLYENSTTGTLSTDGKLVYAVEDLAVAPITNSFMYGKPKEDPKPQPNLGPITDAAYHNKLVAYELKSGKLPWELGGHDEKAGDFKDTFFLGPPLPLEGKLYVLAEKDQELRLFCLDAAKNPHKCAIDWTQKLAGVRDKMTVDIGRRMQAAHLAYGGGILVCPTNAGAVLGVDLLSQSLVWVHSYREKGQLTAQEEEMIRMGMIPPPGWTARNPNATDWKVTAPVITEGKVVFTAPDGRAIHCLNLRDGSLLWKVNRTDDDLYLGGVVAGKVLIVSKKACRALNLADGKQAWQVETGVPSGQGVAADGLYYLPLKVATTIREKEPIPAVAVIDVEKGSLKATTRSRKKEVPGNLLFYEGSVISQTVDAVAAFPQREIKNAEITKLLADNPKDPIGLSERADIALDGGDWQGAVDDLRAALKNKPHADTESKARDKLFGALTEYLRHDFDKAEKYLDELKALCQVAVDPNAPAGEQQQAEAESRRRLVTYFSLLARGREMQGKAVEAVRAYLELTDLGSPNELVASPFDPALKVTLPIMAAGRIKALLEKATPAQRKRIDEEIEKRGKEIRKEGKLGSLRSFVQVFGSSAEGQEARLDLARRLVKSRDFAEAELHLLQVRRESDDPQRAGRATEALALLNLERGLLPDAVSFYRILERDFAKTVLHDGKTGADLFGELATDKRFLPYLADEAKDGWRGRLKGKQEKGQWPQNRQFYTFEPAGEVLPFFQKHRVTLDFQFHALKLFEGDKESWSQNLTRTMFQNFTWVGGQPNNPVRFPYHTVGHVIVLPLAHMVFGLDPLSKQVLWEKSLTGSQPLPQNWNNVIPDPRDGTLSVYYPDGYILKLGQIGPLTPAVLCLPTRDGLMAINPLTGNTLWTRGDVSPRAGIFGDGDHVYVVDVNGDGNPARTRAFRLSDGAPVEVPDFTAAFDRRLAVLGSHLLTADEPKGKEQTFRLIQVATGKELWKRVFVGKPITVRSEVRHLGGALEPDGQLTVVDLATGKEVLRTVLDPRHVEKAQGVTLLQVRDYYYVAINGPLDPNIQNWGGGIMPNLMPNFGYRMVAVNGEVYAFDRRTEKLKWRTRVENQMLILNEVGDLPVLLFTSRYTSNNGGRFMQEVAIKAIQKWSGKIIYDEKLPQNSQQFHALNVDPEAGVIELVAWNLKVRLETVKDPPK